MTEIESPLLAAGPDLDMEVDRALFWQGTYSRIPTVGEPHRWFRSMPQPGNVEPFPHYSDNLGEAWLIVGKMSSDWHMRLLSPFRKGDLWWAGFTPLGSTGWNGKPDHEASAETAPLAICRAALKVIGATDARP